MAVALPPETPTHVDEIPGILRVYVRDMTYRGELFLLPTYLLDTEDNPPPTKAKIPVANAKAFQILYMELCGKIFDWVPVPAHNIHYQNFFRGEMNATYKVFMEIVRTLRTDIRLPEVSCTGTCCISPLCYRDQIYVQMKPAYVDTVSYVIYLSFNNKKARNEIHPVHDIVFGGKYIFTNGVESYRVKLMEMIVTPQPASIVTHRPELSIRHLPELSIRHLPELSIRHLPELSIRHLPELSIRHLPELSIRHMPELSIRHLPELSIRHLPELTITRQPESTVTQQSESTVTQQLESTVTQQHDRTVTQQPERIVTQGHKRFKHDFGRDHSTCRDAFCVSKTRRKSSVRSQSNDGSLGVIRFATRDGRVEIVDKRTYEHIASSVKENKEEQGNTKRGTVQWSDSTSGKGYGNQVLVSLVDFGGLPIEVNRRDLYSIESICPALAKLPDLAIPVEFRFIFGSNQNIEGAAEVLKNMQTSLWIRTLFGGSRNSLPVVEVLSLATRNKDLTQ